MHDADRCPECPEEIVPEDRGQLVSDPCHFSEPTSLTARGAVPCGPSPVEPFDPDELARVALATRHAERRCYRSVKLWLCRRCGAQSPVNARDLCMACQEEVWWAEDNRRVCNWIHRRVEMTDS